MEKTKSIWKKIFKFTGIFTGSLIIGLGVGVSAYFLSRLFTQNNNYSKNVRIRITKPLTDNFDELSIAAVSSVKNAKFSYAWYRSDNAFNNIDESNLNLEVNSLMKFKEFASTLNNYVSLTSTNANTSGYYAYYCIVYGKYLNNSNVYINIPFQKSATILAYTSISKPVIESEEAWKQNWNDYDAEKKFELVKNDLYQYVINNFNSSFMYVETSNYDIWQNVKIISLKISESNNWQGLVLKYVVLINLGIYYPNSTSVDNIKDITNFLSCIQSYSYTFSNIDNSFVPKTSASNCTYLQVLPNSYVSESGFSFNSNKYKNLIHISNSIILSPFSTSYSDLKFSFGNFTEQEYNFFNSEYEQNYKSVAEKNYSLNITSIQNTYS